MSNVLKAFLITVNFVSLLCFAPIMLLWAAQHYLSWDKEHTKTWFKALKVRWSEKRVFVVGIIMLAIFIITFAMLEILWNFNVFGVSL